MKEIKQKPCKACGELFTPFSSLSKACSPICALRLVDLANEKKEQKHKELKAKTARIKLKMDKERIKKRTGKNGHYHNLRTAIHYYVKHILRLGEGCYTCGLKQKSTDSAQAFHVGHFIPAKEVDPRRFMVD